MTILLIDDEPLALEMLKDAVAEACPDAVLHPFLKTSEALAFLQANPVDIAFLDIQMRGMSGLEMAVKCKQLYPKINLIFATGYDSYAIDAMTMHASGYIMKPITAEKVKKELMNLRHPLQSRPGTKLQVKCFGNFDVCLPDGTPLQFARAKSKELLAYLVYRKGTPCSVRELAAVLFEDSDYDRKQQVYLQKIISSMMQTLKQYDLASIVQKRYNSISLDVSVLDCDYYRFLELDPGAINSYTGEFLSQYSWAEFMTGYLDRLTNTK